MTNSKVFSLSSVLSALIVTIFLISGAVCLTLAFRPLYYFDIGHLHIPERSGLSAEEIRLNYDALIDYNSILMRGELDFPTLPMSENGRIHFEEVKNIFTSVQVLCLVSFLACAVLFFFHYRQRDLRFLRLASLFSLGIPAVLGLLIAAGWDKFFVVFHKLFFRNDYWLFDPQTDPVINILPDAFFLHCALMILAVIVLGSLLLFLLGRVLPQTKQKTTDS